MEATEFMVTPPPKKKKKKLPTVPNKRKNKRVHKLKKINNADAETLRRAGKETKSEL